MTISFTPAGGTAVTLAGLGREAAQDFALSFSDQVQSAALARAAAVTLYNRGNRSTSLSWSTARSHASQIAAENFMFDHVAEITPGITGELVCDMAALNSVTFSPAVVRISASRHIGLTTFHTYEAQGTAV